ncbi:MBL fold metallo-hydrolase [Methylobrevis pamukkalensis]|uniref:Hydroxyacylglutathione hydrolase n=1 Tax=Methylobrevis pamukkalensis TaxID=1439726 RepID=A0A1E3H0U9_9HYPH|nr:MBL fold metallo-hydrolase [Methylobrevis pamukkalensis]ODN69765.1 hydroxyacylglutathione hydrolase [Methylobrevis pamukkalensis]
MSALVFDRAFDPAHGEAVELVPGLRRLTAANAGPFTFRGTNSYVVGTGSLVVIDPGPDDAAHVAALVAACGGRPVSHILVTHTHRDHSPAARALQALTGGEIVAEGPHRPARPLGAGEAYAMEASADRDFRPDRILAGGEVLVTPAGRFTAVATPGHTANHLAFALEETEFLFSGDHVMAWSTTVVAPPDGAMADYMASLERIAACPQQVYLPGHGGPVRDGPAFVAGLHAHRLGREAAILGAVAGGADTAPAIVRAVYRDLDPRLEGAAAMSVFSHLEDLVARGRLATDGAPRPDGRYRSL